MEPVGSIIVSWDFSHSEDASVLIVGKQEKGQVKIINAFQGKEALELHKKLTNKEAR